MNITQLNELFELQCVLKPIKEHIWTVCIWMVLYIVSCTYYQDSQNSKVSVVLRKNNEPFNFFYLLTENLKIRELFSCLPHSQIHFVVVLHFLL